MECPPDLVSYLENSAGSVTEGPGVMSSLSLNSFISQSRETLVETPRSDNTPSSNYSDSPAILQEHEDDIIGFYQRELARWQHKYRVLEQRYLNACQRIDTLEGFNQ